MKNVFVRRLISILFSLILISIELISTDLYITSTQYIFALIVVIGIISLARIFTKLDFRIIYGIPVILILTLLIFSVSTYWLDLLSKESIKEYLPWIRTIIDGGIISYLNDSEVIKCNLTNKNKRD